MSIAVEAEAIINPQSYAKPDSVYTLLAKIRSEQPICKVELEGYPALWLITKNEDIEYIEGKPELFLAGPRTVAHDLETMKAVDEQVASKGLVGMDGEEHRKYRQLAQAWFMPRNLKTLQSAIDDMAKRYVDLLEEKAPQCDFATDVAFWYPLRVILSLAGLPEENDETVIKLTQQIFGVSDDDLMAEERLPLMEVIGQFYELLGPIVAERQANPSDDLISALVHSEIDGKPVGMEEILSYILIVMTAGHDTTSASLAGGLLALMEHPEQMQKLKDNPALIPSAVEEILRWVAPVKHFVRTTAEEVQVGGQTIAKGEDLLLHFSSACRDESVFADADQFRIDRKPNKHMAFGFGPHMCLGKYLAKMELEAYLKELLPRLDSVELDGEPKYLISNFVSGIKNMPIKFSFK